MYWLIGWNTINTNIIKRIMGNMRQPLLPWDLDAVMLKITSLDDVKNESIGKCWQDLVYLHQKLVGNQ